MKLIKDTEKQTVNALDAINSCESQEEALELLKELFEAKAKFDIICWFAFNNLPKKSDIIQS